jgi:hypothetical protein
MYNLAKAALFMCVLVAANAIAVPLTGSLSTPSSQGLISDGITWQDGQEGLTVSWAVSENPDGSWHYQYTFTNAVGDTLDMLVSHFIISLSEDIEPGEIFNFSPDVASHSIDTFGPHVSNPGFPEGETIWGLKLDLGNDQIVAAFDSYRMPMWGDFYAKDGGDPVNWAYNTDFGIEVANLHDYEGVPVDEFGNPLFKVLVPNTIPEPATIAMLALGGLFIRRTRR